MIIQDHIAQVDDLLTAQECNDIIEHWEWLHSQNLSYTRSQLGDHSGTRKKDTTVFALEQDSMRLAPDQPFMATFLARFWEQYNLYLGHYDPLRDTADQWIRGMRIQKTQRGEGYHQWHYEADGADRCRRVTAWMLYLNSVSRGGETEFLYQHTRIEPVQGRLLIWPAGYTHVHRGNPPLEGVKYILTGWCEW